MFYDNQKISYCLITTMKLFWDIILSYLHMYPNKAIQENLSCSLTSSPLVTGLIGSVTGKTLLASLSSHLEGSNDSPLPGRRVNEGCVVSVEGVVVEDWITEMGPSEPGQHTWKMTIPKVISVTHIFDGTLYFINLRLDSKGRTKSRRSHTNNIKKCCTLRFVGSLLHAACLILRVSAGLGSCSRIW